MKRLSIRTFVVVLLSIFLAKKAYPDTINIDDPTTILQYIEKDNTTLNVNSTGSIKTTKNKEALVILGVDNTNINIRGEVVSENRSALFSNSNIGAPQVQLLGSGKVENNSATWSTIYSMSDDGFDLWVSAGSSVKNLSSDSFAPSYAVSIIAYGASTDSYNITNYGEISGPGGVSFTGSVLGDNPFVGTDTSFFTIANAGLIRSNNSSSYAIKVENSVLATINNSGTIIGNIRALSDSVQGNATIDLVNSGIITGNIDLGTNSASKIDLESGGVITGDATFGNSAQVFNIKQGATFNGSISGTLSAVNLAGILNFTESGTFSGNVIGAGTGNLNLGATSQTINGNLTLNAGDTLGVTFAADGSFGFVNVNGAANINADSKIAVSLASDYTYLTDGSSYKILQGGTGSNVATISNNNINVNNSGSNGFSVLRFSSRAENNDSLYLSVSRAEASYVSSNTNSQSVYNNLNQIGASATGTMALFQQYIDTSSSQSDVDKALKSATPQADDGIRQNNLNIVNSSFANIENRLDQFSKHQSKQPTKTFRLKSVKQDQEVTESTETNSASSNQTIGSWAQVNAESSTQGDEQDSQGYKSNRQGLAFGFDKVTDSGAVVGVAVNLSNSDIKSSDNLKKTNVDTYQLSAYSRHLFANNYFFDSMASFALNTYKTNRSIYPISANANAKFHGEVYSARARFGFNKDLGSKFELTPDLALTYAGGGTNSYNEEGAGTMNLRVAANSFDFFESRAGLKLNYKTKISDDLFAIPHLKLSYGYDLIGDRQYGLSSFEGKTTDFTTKYGRYDRSSLRIGAGINLYSLDSLKITGEYNLEEKSRYRSHSGFLRVAYRFY